MVGRDHGDGGIVARSQEARNEGAGLGDLALAIRQLGGDLPLRLQKREGSRSLPFAPLAGGHV